MSIYSDGPDDARIKLARGLFKEYNGVKVSHTDPQTAKELTIRFIQAISNIIGADRLMLKAPFYIEPDYFPVLGHYDEEVYELGFSLGADKTLFGRILGMRVSKGLVAIVLEGMSVVLEANVLNVYEKSKGIDFVEDVFTGGDIEKDPADNMCLMNLLSYESRTELDRELKDLDDIIGDFLGPEE